jgi:hypothetical protein
LPGSNTPAFNHLRIKSLAGESADGLKKTIMVDSVERRRQVRVRFFGGSDGRLDGRVVEVEAAGAVEGFFGAAAGESSGQELVFVAAAAGQVETELQCWAAPP